MDLKENERIDDLEYKGLKIIQNEKYFCFGIDSILLSDFAKEIKKDAIILDIGTGTGIISILLAKKTECNKIYALEVQEEISEMAMRSVKLNKLENKIQIINDNIKNIEKYLQNNSINAIVRNHPYKRENSGVKNENMNKLISRHEITANLEDFISNGSKILKDKGNFYMVNRPERLAEIITLFKKYRIEPKRLRIVYSKINSKPNLILIKGVKNAKPFLEIEKPLIIYNNDNTYTDEILEIYNKK